MEENNILLEFVDDDEYAFFKYFPQIEQLIIKENSTVSSRLDFNKFHKSFFNNHGFEFIKLHKNNYIITSNVLNATYFISFNTINVLNYCLRQIPEKYNRQRFVNLIKFLSKEVDTINNRIIERSSYDMLKDTKSRYTKNNNMYVTEQEIVSMNFPTDLFERRYFKIYIGEKDLIENNIFSIYRLHKGLNDLNIDLVKGIFSQMDYIYIKMFKDAIKEFPKQDEKYISELIAKKFIQEQKSMTDIIENECLEIRRKVIESLINARK